MKKKIEIVGFVLTMIVIVLLFTSCEQPYFGYVTDRLAVTQLEYEKVKARASEFYTRYIYDRCVRSFYYRGYSSGDSCIRNTLLDVIDREEDDLYKYLFALIYMKGNHERAQIMSGVSIRIVLER